MGRFGELVTCRRKYLLNYFDEPTEDYCGNCDICLASVELYNATVFAQKVISAVVRLHERFGARYIIDFLRGSHAARVQDEHKTLKTFGAGAETGRAEWNTIIRELVERGYLAKTEGMYPVLKLTEKSTDVLKGTEKVMLIRTRERAEMTTVREEPVNYETELFQQLKKIRKVLAEAENVAAYIVLSDATLIELATYLPHNKEEFGQISGFGQVKLEKYGKHFWEVVAAYCVKHNLKSRIHLKTPKRQRGERTERENETKRETFKLFTDGYTVEKIASMRNLSKNTVEGHLVFYVQEGKLSIDRLLPPEKYTAIKAAIKSIGGKSLTPIKQALGDDYTFNEIRYVMAYLEHNKLEEVEYVYTSIYRSMLEEAVMKRVA